MDTQNQETLAKVYEYAYKLKRGGKTTAAIKQELLMQGLDDKSAETIAENIDLQYKEITKKISDKNLLYGTLWCAGGIIVTATVYSNTYKSVSLYAVAGSTILLGVIQLFRGLAQRA